MLLKEKYSFLYTIVNEKKTFVFLLTMLILISNENDESGNKRVSIISGGGKAG